MERKVKKFRCHRRNSELLLTNLVAEGEEATYSHVGLMEARLLRQDFPASDYLRLGANTKAVFPAIMPYFRNSRRAFIMPHLKYVHSPPLGP